MPVVEVLPSLARGALPPVLAALVEIVRAALADTGSAEKAMRERVVPALKRAAAERGLLAPDQRRAQAGGYARHLLYSDPNGRFTIVAIVWGAGQFSPAHGHHTWCAYAVHENTLHETLYAWDVPSGTARPKAAHDRPPGYGCFARAGLDQIHRLGNSGGEPAISIHVYGVDCAKVCTHVNRMVETASQ
jgi:predicted metal-dependent enzyme (double-stranded beta helix superfamily)